MTARTITPAVCDGVTYNIISEPNPKAANSGLKQFKGWVSNADGPYRFAQAIEKPAKWGTELLRLAGATDLSQSMKDIASTGSKISSAFVVPYFAWKSVVVKEGIDDLSNPATGGVTYDKVEVLTQNVCDLVMAGSYSALHFCPGNTVLPVVAQVADLGSDTIDLKRQAEGWVRADQLQQVQNIPQTLRNELGDKKTHHFFSLLKAICSVAGGIFGILAIIYKAAVIPAVITLTISLAALVFTVIKFFYNENLPNHITIERQIAPVTP